MDRDHFKSEILLARSEYTSQCVSIQIIPNINKTSDSNFSVRPRPMCALQTLARIDLGTDI